MELIVDASPVALGAILVQNKSDEDSPGCVVVYASRELTDVERRYSQTGREALAIIGGVNTFTFTCTATSSCL